MPIIFQPTLLFSFSAQDNEDNSLCTNNTAVGNAGPSSV